MHELPHVALRDTAVIILKLLVAPLQLGLDSCHLAAQMRRTSTESLLGPPRFVVHLVGLRMRRVRHLQVQRSVLCLRICIGFLCLAELDIIAHIRLIRTRIAQRCLKGM